MISNKGQIKHSDIFVQPSKRLLQYIKEIKNPEGAPIGIQTIIFKNKPQKEFARQSKLKHLLTSEDMSYISSLNLKTSIIESQKPAEQQSKKNDKDSRTLALQDLHWLYAYIKAQNLHEDTKVYLHELLEGSEIILPTNEEIPRNPELEKRCQKLKAEQQNREYQNMTKNVDSFRRKLPEDTIAYQLKMINSHLIAVFQAIMSVAAGFAFGFIGVELLIGNIDFAMRLVLGIACALIVAIAELYFLAKKLNEDLEFENRAKQNWQPEEKKVK